VAVLAGELLEMGRARRTQVSAIHQRAPVEPLTNDFQQQSTHMQRIPSALVLDVYMHLPFTGTCPEFSNSLSTKHCFINRIMRSQLQRLVSW
jgi:hypothetical protein